MDLLELSDSSLAYLKARYDKLGEKDRLVSILMDEVNSHQTVEYVNGKFYRLENGQLTKTPLCVMV